MVVTTGRADYGLLTPLLHKLANHSFFTLFLTVTGSHLSEIHGNTIVEIENDGFEISHKVDMNVHIDSEEGICDAIARGLTGVSAAITAARPDIMVVLGDRFELLAAGTAATIHKIPIAHIHGGESTFGSIDDAIRHALTKMSSFHFTSLPLYADRIVQMGEHPSRVHTVGALGLDNIQSIRLMSLSELSEYTNIDFEKRTALMTYHPVTLDNPLAAETQTKAILDALAERGISTLITMPNTDTAGRMIYHMIREYEKRSPETFTLIKNLGQQAYLSAMKYSCFMIGNSSSGIIESASFRLPTINIGDRQAGRFRPANVIDCGYAKENIKNSIDKALSMEFKHSIANVQNPYGDGNASNTITKILTAINPEEKKRYLKKGFFDLPEISAMVASMKANESA